MCMYEPSVGRSLSGRRVPCRSGLLGLHPPEIISTHRIVRAYAHAAALGTAAAAAPASDVQPDIPGVQQTCKLRIVLYSVQLYRVRRPRIQKGDRLVKS
jgi:hypothetical protein